MMAQGPVCEFHKFGRIDLYLHMRKCSAHFAWAEIPGGRGGGGGTRPPPPTILKVGDTISNVPPRFCGRTIFRRKNRILTKFVDFFL